MRGLRWYDATQYVALLMMAAAVPVGWRFGLWTALLLAAVSLIKMIAQHRVGNPALDRPLRLALYTPIVYWLVQAVSLLWSDDLVTGLVLLRLKAVLLIFPLCFLLSDTSYLTSCRLRALGYALLISVVGGFLYFSTRAGIDMVNGSSFKAVTGATFDTRHHAYIALYATVAMVFVYHELSCRWKQMKGWHRGLLIATLPVLVCYVVLVNSRAGILAMGLTVVACVVHFAVMHRNWKLTVAIGLLAVAVIVAATQLLPGYVNRISSTLENVEKDARTQINQSNWHAYLKSPLLGYGAGDYHACQVQQYEDDGFGSGVTAEFNAHNQYMESLLSAGVLGLVALLCFLVVPVIITVCQHSRFSFEVTLVVAIVMLNLLFESMLERQMGLLFIGFLMPTMVLIMSAEKNKFAHLANN